VTDELALTDGWLAAACPPDAAAEPAALDALALDWLPAQVPGTAAAALRDAGRWHAGGPAPDLDASDWWFRCRFDAAPPAEGERLLLALDGVATVAEVHLNGALVAASESMFAPSLVDVGALVRAEGNELAIRCRALAPLLRVRRKPRARWRTQLVDGNLRWFRTMLLGRAPGFAPGPAAVGPWRPVRLLRCSGVAIERVALRPRVDGGDGLLAAEATIALPAGVAAERVTATVVLDGPSGRHEAALTVAVRPRDGDGDGDAPSGRGTAGGATLATVGGELRIPRVARWLPHTHGEPLLHDVTVTVEAPSAPAATAVRRVGFRTLAAGAAPGHDVESDGLDLHLDGVRVFARGVLWTPPDPVGLAPPREQLRAALEQLRDAGMNMVRLPGTGAYESAAFHDLCDELGLLVWQDFMFANLDYPVADDGFRALVTREAAELLERLAGRPSTVVLCGNSEVEQQVAMLGLDPALGRGELFGELLPRAVEAAGADAVYLPSAPCGGTLPFRPDRGVANWFGVGGYRRPLEEARRAGVRFASECLAFANVPDEAGVEAIGAAVVHDPRWKAGVPRDTGPGWDFDDVRDHYLALLFGVDPVALRSVDPARYLELSRAVTGEAMAEVFGEWRRAGSGCGGGLVLWARDLVPGAGWGVIDHAGAPKPAYHHLRRALAPIAVWTTDEGLGGVAVHVANDRPQPLEATLRVALYRDGERCVADGSETLRLAPHATVARDAETVIGRFADAAWAYRFGPPEHDAVVATLLGADGEPIARSFRFPVSRTPAPESAERLGLVGEAGPPEAGGAVPLTVRTRRLAQGVRVHAPGFRADDDAFSLEPGGALRLLLRPRHPAAALAGAALTALNLSGRVRISSE